MKIIKPLLVLLLILSISLLSGSYANAGLKKEFNVRRHGAVGDGKTLDTEAIQRAVDAASSSGGGIVVLPAGTYLSSTIRMKINITLHIEKEATLLGSPERMGYQKGHRYALIVAEGQNNIGISGKGTIDGNGKLLNDDTYRLAAGGVLPTANNNRPFVINLFRCKNVTIRDITIRNGAFWIQDYRECEDLLIENIIVRSNVVVNNDGLDITDCKRVVVRGCDIDSEDDGICPKSSSSFGCEDILIENCRIRSSCNALKFGTSSVGGFKNVTVRNLEIYDTYTSGIALEIVDGGKMENVNISNIKITNTNNPLFIRLGHRNVDGQVGTLRNITISDVAAEIPDRPDGVKSGNSDFWGHMKEELVTGMIAGIPGHPVRDIKLRNISFIYGGIGNTPIPKHVLLKDLVNVPEQLHSYPDANRFGTVPAWGLYIRHAEGIELENVTLQLKDGGTDYRAALVCDDVKNISLNHFNVLSAGTEPIIVLHDVQGAKIRNSVAPPKAVKLIETMGNTSDIKTP